MTTGEKFEKVADAVYDKGRHDEWSDFWDVFQDNGKRTDYGYAFGTDSGSSPFNNSTFKPKYDIRPTNANRMFKLCKELTDIKGSFEAQGVVLDFSNCTNLAYVFQSCLKNTRLPVIDFSKCTALTLPFTYNESLISIDKLIVSDSGTTTFTDTFAYCNSLAEIRFGGVIGRSISFQYSPLSVESMKDIIAHLANYKGTADEAKYKVTIKSDRWEALEASGKPFDDGLTSDNTLSWMNYVISLGWNV